MESKPTKPRRDPPTPKPPKKRELARWLEETRPRRIGEAEWESLLRLLAPVSESYLRHLLRDFSRDSGVALAPLIEGVRQDSFEVLEGSLLKLLAEYESGDAARRSRARNLVIEAKDHARLAARKPGLRPDKQEMILWMLTWLENPAVFPDWVRLRRAALGAA